MQKASTVLAVADISSRWFLREAAHESECFRAPIVTPRSVRYSTVCALLLGTRKVKMQQRVKDWKKFLLYKLTWEPYNILGVCRISRILPVFYGRPSAWNNSAPTGHIFFKFYWEILFKICRENPSWVKIGRKYTLYEDLNRFIIISRWILPRMKKFHIKPVEQIKAGSHVSHKLHFSRSRAVYEIITLTAAQSDRQQTIVRDRVQRIFDLHAGYLRQIYIS
jgi:hypothetical protein